MKHEPIERMNKNSLAKIIASRIKKYLPEVKVISNNKITSNQSIDCIFDLEFPDKTLSSVFTIVKQDLRPSMLPLVKSRFGEINNAYNMVVSDYITPPIAKNLRETKTWFMDEVGNIFIEIPGKIFIFDIGYKKNSSTKPSSLISSTNAKLFFFLLKNGPELKGTYRHMAEHAGVSLGKIAQVLTDLKQRELIYAQNDGITLRQPLKFLELWVQGYLEKLKAQLYIGTYTWPYGKDFSFLEKLASQYNGDIGIGGEYAGEILTGYLNPADMELWIEAKMLPNIRKSLKLMESVKGNIRVFSLFPGEILIDAPINRSSNIKIVHPLIAYADMLGISDSRCQETAKMIRKTYLEWINEIKQ